MPSISEIIRVLGNDRAVANAQAEILRAQREEWVIANLCLRLDSLPSWAVSAPAANARTDAA